MGPPLSRSSRPHRGRTKVEAPRQALSKEAFYNLLAKMIGALALAGREVKAESQVLADVQDETRDIVVITTEQAIEMLRWALRGRQEVAEAVQAILESP
jgi:hypothetical protein